MAFFDHILACNTHDMSNFLPFLARDQRIGWVHRRWLPLFGTLGSRLNITQSHIALPSRWQNAAECSAALDEICTLLADHLPPRRNEKYAVRSHWGQPVLLEIDRAFASLFGIRAYGVHINGLVQRPDGWWLWVARRAANRPVAPGKLDNLIAGGQPAHLSLRENILKEAAEEADIPPHLAAQARPAGCISYCMEDELGLKPDTMFCFDLLLPEDFVPHNADGEAESFDLLPLSQVARLVDQTDDFKFNVNLVIIDLLIRYGLLHPDDQPDYSQLVTGLRRELP